MSVYYLIMNISDLLPDLTFPKLKAKADDMVFAFDAKRAALGPHIVRRWGWDEETQRSLHCRRYQEKPFFEIRNAKDRMGTMSFQIFPEHVQFGEFYLFPEFQNLGIGSRVLQHCLRHSDNLSLPMRLEYLRWSPVGTLYRRNGFVEIGQSDIHCFMERPLPE